MRRTDWRNVYLLSVIAFVVTLGFGAVGLMIPYLLLYYKGLLRELPEELERIPQAGAIAFETATLTSAFMLTRALLARRFGALSDKVGRKPLIVAGLSLYVILSYLYTLARSWLDLLAIRAMQGVASAMVWPVAEALVADSSLPSERGRAMGVYMTATNLSFIAGPALGVTFYKVAVHVLGLGVPDCLIVPFYFLLLMSASALAISLLVRDVGVVRRARVAVRRLKVRLPPEVSRALLVIYVMGLANGVAVGFVFPVMQVFIMQYITSDPLVIGLISSVSGAVGVAANYPAGWLSDRIGRKRLIVLGQLSLRTATALIPFVRTVDELLALSVARSLMFNIVSPAYRALQADLVPLHIRGRVFGTVQSLFNFGAALAPLGGLVYAHLSTSVISVAGTLIPAVAVVFWFSATLGFITTALFILYVPDPTKLRTQRAKVTTLVSDSDRTDQVRLMT